MEKIALITDSTSDLTQEIKDQYNVRILPFRIVYKDRDYLDRVEITPEEVYERLPVEVPTTSMPSFKEITELYDELKRENYTHAIFITISTGLSGIQNAIRLVSDKYPEIPSFIYDSKSISIGEGILVQEVGKMIQAGKSYEEITSALPELRKKLHLYFVVGTLEYLKKGGRIGKVVGTISEILRIKPIIAIEMEEGRYYTVDKVRGRKQSLNRMYDIAKEILDQKKCKIHALSGDAQEEAEQIVERLSTHPNAVSAEYNGAISPVSGVHSGPGLVGVMLWEV